MYYIFNLVIQVTFVIYIVSGHEEDDICYYKTLEPSQCISLDDCEELKPLTKTSRERLKKLHCGFVQNVPKVCCPIKPTAPTKAISPTTITYTEPPDSHTSCVTLDNKHGTCVPLSNCSLLVNMIMKGEDVIEYVQQSRCDDKKKINVCCEISSRLTSRQEGQFWNTKEKLCKVPNGDAGVCIQIQKCPPLMDLYKKKHKTPEENMYLQQSYCSPPRSNKIKLCCPPESQWSIFEAKPVLYPTLAQSPAPVTNKPVTKVTERILMAPTTGSIGADLDNRYQINEEELNKNCGIDASSANKIFGGSDVAIDQYPWMALLQYAGNALLCGGSLISSQFVLTAAHCIRTTNGEPLFVRLAEYNISSYPTDYVEVDGDGTDEITVEIIPVNDFYVHPDFDRTAKIHDIALIRLSKHVNIKSDFIKAICLPTTNILPELKSPTNFTISGWGSTATDILSEVKQEANVPWVRCKGKRHTDYHICAGGEEGVDSCFGDSGGPLMQLHKDRYYVVGVISYGFRTCATKGEAATHAYVYKYLSWIQRVMNGTIKN